MITVEGFQLTVTRNLNVAAGINTMTGLCGFSRSIHLAALDGQSTTVGIDGVGILCHSGYVGIGQGDVTAFSIDGGIAALTSGGDLRRSIILVNSDGQIGLSIQAVSIGACGRGIHRTTIDGQVAVCGIDT